MAGEWSKTLPATEETQKICDQVIGQVEAKIHMCYREFKAVKYRNQFSEGGEYFLIEVHVGGEHYIHVSLFQPLDGKFVVRGLMQHKTIDDPLKPFLN